MDAIGVRSVIANWDRDFAKMASADINGLVLVYSPTDAVVTGSSRFKSR